MAEGDGSAPSSSRPFHEKLDRLFRTVRNPKTGRPFSLREVTALLPSNTTGVTASYLSLLRRGERTNPGLDLVTDLAGVFEVPTSYFFDDDVAATVDQQITARNAWRELQEAMDRPHIAASAARAQGLSPKVMEGLLELAETLAHREVRPPASSTRPFHDKLDRLFATVRNPETNEPFTVKEVAAHLPANIPGVTPAFLSQLRRGEKRNPGVELVNSLARIFGVPATYFTDDSIAERVDEQLTTLYAMRDLQDVMKDPHIPILAARARGLSPSVMGQLLELVKTFRELEGLDQSKTDQS